MQFVLYPWFDGHDFTRPLSAGNQQGQLSEGNLLHPKRRSGLSDRFSSNQTRERSPDVLGRLPFIWYKFHGDSNLSEAGGDFFYGRYFQMRLLIFTQAWNACPKNVGLESSCLNNSDWRLVDPFNTKMTISERRASTVFNRFNFTIMDVIDLSPPVPTNYTPDDFFLFYEIIFSADESQPDLLETIKYQFLTSVASFLRDDISTESETGTDDRLSRLQELLCVPLVVFNNVVYGGPTSNMGKSVTLSIPSYRVSSTLSCLLTPS